VCLNCHGDTTHWRNASFSHPWLNIYYEGPSGACVNCHPGNNYAVTDCATRHAIQWMLATVVRVPVSR